MKPFLVILAIILFLTLPWLGSLIHPMLGQIILIPYVLAILGLIGLMVYELVIRNE